ncbi:MAG: integrase arm-type DNA-binding domain-containing protein [Xanthomonadales bacterium]|nr:integrase arm-type DNA-binding domain-containing protein [Xanthomonadales bacterium]
MPKQSNRLTAVAIRNPKAGRHWDGLGLYLEVTEQGGRYWRYKYRFGGKEKRLALGVFPEVSLADARKSRDDARESLRGGVDPSEQRRLQRIESSQSSQGSFGVACAGWLKVKGPDWSPESQRKAEYITRTYLLPKLKDRPMAMLSSKEVVAVLRKIAEQTPDIARKARQYVQGIVKHAIREGLRDDGRLLVLDESLPRASRSHIPAETLPEDIGKLLRAVRTYPTEVTRAALMLCAYTAQRPGVVVAIRWDELSEDTTEWRIPAEKMKTRHAHIVPLPKQARALIESMKPYSSMRDFIFPPLARQSTPHLHRDALSNALRRMGFAGKHATHGFRGMFRTAGRERLGIEPDVLEAQLAHAKRGDVQKAYDRTTFGVDRKAAMQKWADWLDKISSQKSAATLGTTAANNESGSKRRKAPRS